VKVIRNEKQWFHHPDLCPVSPDLQSSCQSPDRLLGVCNVSRRPVGQRLTRPQFQLGMR
jgi:hypothetical protein